MILNFHVAIEVSDNYGEKQVPYLKQLLANKIDHVGVIKFVLYEPWLTDKNDQRAEQAERIAYEEGKIDL